MCNCSQNLTIPEDKCSRLAISKERTNLCDIFKINRIYFYVAAQTVSPMTSVVIIFCHKLMLKSWLKVFGMLFCLAIDHFIAVIINKMTNFVVCYCYRKHHSPVRMQTANWACFIKNGSVPHHFRHLWMCPH